MTVDIAKPEGQQIIRELAAQSDVVLENYKVGELPRYGLDYESLKAVKPELVYCSVTGFGQTGPVRGARGLRLHDPGHRRLHEHHRRARRPAGRRPAEGRRRDRGPDDRHVRDDRRDGRPRPPRPNGRRAIYRHGAARHAGRDAREHEHELPRERPAAGAQGQRASEHRALPDLPDERRLDHRRGAATTTSSASSSMRAAARNSPTMRVLRRTRRACGTARRSCRSSPRWCASAASTNGSRRSKRRACRAVRSTISAKCSRTRRWSRAGCRSSCRIRRARSQARREPDQDERDAA